MSQNPSEHSAYYTAVSAADDHLEDALGHVRACRDAGEITVQEAADERVRLLENHMARVQELRREHMGDEGRPGMICALPGGLLAGITLGSLITLRIARHHKLT